MELGSHREMDSPLLQLLFGHCLRDFFFFFVHTGVEIAIGEVRKLLRIGGVGTLTFVVLAVAGGLFGLYGSERADELVMSPLTPPAHLHRP